MNVHWVRAGAILAKGPLGYLREVRIAFTCRSVGSVTNRGWSGVSMAAAVALATDQGII